MLRKELITSLESERLYVKHYRHAMVNDLLTHLRVLYQCDRVNLYIFHSINPLPHIIIQASSTEHSMTFEFLKHLSKPRSDISTSTL